MRFCIRVRRFGSIWEVQIAKVQKVALFALWRSRIAQVALLHTCTTFLLDLGGQNRKSATFCTFCTLALPNRPSRTFAYVYDVFARSGRSKIAFCTFGLFRAVHLAVRVRWAEGRTDRHLIPGTGCPMAGPAAPTDPPAAGGGRQSKHIPCGGPQAFPPPLQYVSPTSTPHMSYQVVLAISVFFFACIYLWGPGEARGSRGGSHCGVSCETRVLHLGSRLRPATAALARGGVRVWPTSLLHADPESFIFTRFLKGFGPYLGKGQIVRFPIGFECFQESFHRTPLIKPELPYAT